MKADSTPKNPVLSSSTVSLVPPKFVQRSGTALVSSYASFFSQTLNENTNQAYANGVKLFCDFLTKLEIENILDIEPKHITEFVTYTSDNDYGVATTRLYLSAVRMFLDGCVVDGLISVNPAKAVKLPRHSSRTGKTPVIMPTQVRQILDSIPLLSQADYRDRALIGLMVFSFFRVSAALALRLKDYELRGEQRWIIGEEKGSKRHEMPVHPTLEVLLDEYIAFIGMIDPSPPLFQSSNARGGKLTGRQFDRTAAWRMVRRRAAAAGVHREIGNHSFRATGITTYLNAGGSLEDARIMANHSNATTTKLYDRTGDTVKIKEVNRIDI